jgi:hypothetical protein
VFASQVPEHDGVVDAPERLLRTFAALHLRELAHARDELVRAVGGIARFPRLLADEPDRIDVLATAKELPEQPQLLGRRARRRDLRILGGLRTKRFLECRQVAVKGRDACFHLGELASQLLTSTLLRLERSAELGSFGRRRRPISALARRCLNHDRGGM